MSIVKVANIAGVSNSTVSRVINGYTNVSPETVLAVKKAIKKLGYEPLEPSRRRGPSSYAQAGVKTRNIAVVWFDAVSELTATHFIQAVNSISEALIEQGLNPILCNLYNSGKLPPSIAKSNIDGCIVISGEPTGQFTQNMTKLPVVWMSSRSTPTGEYVIDGNEVVGRMAAEYLIGRGHKSIAFLNPFPNQPGIVARGKGLKYVAYQSNVEVKDFAGRLSARYPQTLKELENEIVIPILEQFLHESPRPTSLFIPEDMVTAVVYRLLLQKNIKPLKEIDIISADNETPYLAGLNPRPATIDIGCRINGRHAVEQLMWKLRNPSEQRSVQVVIEPVLIEGDRI